MNTEIQTREELKAKVKELCKGVKPERPKSKVQLLEEEKQEAIREFKAKEKLEEVVIDEKIKEDFRTKINNMHTLGKQWMSY